MQIGPICELCARPLSLLPPGVAHRLFLQDPILLSLTPHNVAFVERIEQELLEKVPHRQYVVTIPKMLRIFLGTTARSARRSEKCFLSI